MFVEHIEVSGFRGINRLSLSLEHTNVLIGENAWGKSSLLDALSLLLAPGKSLYHFTRDDFYFPPGDRSGQQNRLHIVITFRERQPGGRELKRLAQLAPLWSLGTDGFGRIFFRLEGELADDGSVMTLRRFLNGEGKLLDIEDIDQYATRVVCLNPVLRLRDARFMRRLNGDDLAPLPQAEITARQLNILARELVSSPQNLSDSQLHQGLNAMSQLLEHYFTEQSTPVGNARGRRYYHDSRHGWRYLDAINQMIGSSGGRNQQMILLGMFATLLRAKSGVKLESQSRPLLLIEDPETRLHPIMLSVAWHLLNLLPLQKVTTTNSGELLSLTPVEQVCRLVREPSRVAAWRLGAGGLNAEDTRRISFHIRFNRPSSLFARCWLLVEGETEVWLINELASQCGYRFDTEGIKVIEFAQCGLRPLIKFARRMGIDWHVLTDGDDAGRKYAATARSLLDNDTRREQLHLTSLPALDIEHFMYREGFRDVYHQVAQLADNVPMNSRRIITRAIHRSSKPDLALEVAMAASRRGVNSIPQVLREMFSRVLWLARGRAD